MNTVTFPKISPKAPIRHAEGHGRDTYITVDNGDNCHDKSRFHVLQAKDKTPSRFLRMKPHQMIRPSQGPKMTHYVQDGNGRDTYISSNHGG